MSVPVEAINEKRFANWQKDFNADHATPFFAVGATHDNQGGQGRMVVCMVSGEGADLPTLCLYAKAVLTTFENMLTEEILRG